MMNNLFLRFTSKNRQRGFTLVETSLALVSVAALVAGAMWLYGSTSSQNKSQAAVSELNSIRKGAEQLRQIGSGAMSNAALVQTDAIPKHMISTSVAEGMIHAFKGGVEIGTIDSGATYFVKFHDIKNQTVPTSYP